MRIDTSRQDNSLHSGSNSADALAATAAEFGLPMLDMSAFDLSAIPGDLVDAELVRRHRVLPLSRRGNRMTIAIARAADLAALDAIKFSAGVEVEGVLVEAGKLDVAIERYRSGQGDRTLAELARRDEGNRGASLSGLAERAVDEAPIVKYVHQVLVDAVHAGASDIHFEPYEDAYRIRTRVDGILRETGRPPATAGPRLAARLKVMSQLDVTERRVPQDGRIKLNAGGGDTPDAVDFRVSTLPTMHGEKVVLRVLDQSSARLDIEHLGMEDDQRRRYLDALGQPQGMILVTGPTGSGKTVSLYAGLKLLNDEQRNIATAEDPVEINIEGINQVQVNPKVGLNFATALRAFLRQDPDVVMVGEIRDGDTAQTAIKAAQTGHLVLSTLHTNSAAETLSRLRTMGIPAFNLATSVTLIVAQRLARILCHACRRPIVVPADVLLEEGFDEADINAGVEIFEASADGCERCDQGYRGRTGIYEVVAVASDLQRLILADASSLALAAEARSLGFDDLRRAGLKKVRRGLTSLREVNRVTARG